MRVLYIPSWYPSVKNPWAGSFIEQLALDLHGDDIEIQVAAFHYHFKDISKKTYSKKVRNGLIEHHFSGWVFPKVNAFFQRKWIDYCMGELESTVDLTGVDFIHAHDYVASFLAYELSLKTNIPMISTMHHSDIMMDLVPEWRKDLLQSVFSHSKEIVVPSTALQRSLNKYFQTDSIVIPNYIDSTQYEFKKELNKSPKKLISVSSLEPLKNIEETIQYMKDWDGTIDIFGDGPSKNKLENSIKNEGLESKVRLKGAIPHSELLNKYQEYDAFISTSEYETFGLSILEAIASGIPVMVKNQYGPKDFLSKENGMFIKNIEDVHTFFSQYYKYDAESIRNSVIPKYDKTNVIEIYRKFYRNLYSSLCVV